MKRVKTKWVLNLPVDSKVKVKKGQEVAMDEILAEVMLAEERVVSLANQMTKLGATEVQNLKNKIMGTTIQKGEVIWKTGGLFSKKVVSPTEGEVRNIDEYFNLYLKLPGEKLKTIVSPTEAVVAEIDDEKITIEFKAVEFTGVGVSEGRVWGRNGLKVVLGINDLSVLDTGKIMIISDLNQAILAKAEVVGVTGVVILNDVKINSRLPILKVETEEFNNILTESSHASRAMLNANGGRLLLVI